MKDVAIFICLVALFLYSFIARAYDRAEFKGRLDAHREAIVKLQAKINERPLQQPSEKKVVCVFKEE